MAHKEVQQRRQTFPIYLVCAHWEDPLNVGAAFRLADACGLAGIVLEHTSPSPPHRKIAKVARATEKAVPWQSVADLVAFLKQQQAEGAYLLALEITDSSQDIFHYSLPPELSKERPIYLLAGSESHGINPELLAICDAAVHLPMYGQNSSMNVGLACGAAVYLLLEKLNRGNDQ